MSEAIDELAELVADLRAHLEWGSMLGADVLPRERVEPRTPPTRVPSLRAGSGRRQGSQRGRSIPNQAPVRSKPRQEPVRSVDPQAKAAPSSPNAMAAPSPDASGSAGASLSSKWEQVLRAPSTHSSVGPAEASLVIVRGAGSSTEAETMLTNMIERVLNMKRAGVRILDIARDGRAAEVVGRGILNALRQTKPKAVLVLGVHAARALLGDGSTVADVRGTWHVLQWEDGEAPMRVTHHPEAIRALAARGSTDARRDAFEDLKAVRDRLR